MFEHYQIPKLQQRLRVTMILIALASILSLLIVMSLANDVDQCTSNQPSVRYPTTETALSRALRNSPAASPAAPEEPRGY